MFQHFDANRGLLSAFAQRQTVHDDLNNGDIIIVLIGSFFSKEISKKIRKIALKMISCSFVFNYFSFFLHRGHTG